MGIQTLLSGSQYELLKAFLNSGGNSSMVDAFSRLRVSAPVTLFESQTQYNANALRMEPGNSGDAIAPSWSANTRLVTLQINAGAAGGTCFLQSFEYMPYQPGKSQFIFITGVLGTATAGAVKRYGYGDASNGIFYEQNGTSGLQFNRRTSTSGGVINNTVAQSAWNLDKLDGTGASGINLDVTKDFILVIDLQFLSMGRVRCGFDIDGIIVYAHQFLSANVLTVPYMQTATLPIMIELVAAAGLAAPATSAYKCSVVMSEAGFEFGLGRDFATEGTATVGVGAGRTQLLSLRPLTTFNGLTNRGLFVFRSVDIIAGAGAVKWELCIGVGFTVAPAFSAVNSTYSFMEAGTGGTVPVLTNGIIVASGYVASGGKDTNTSAGNEFDISYPISLSRAGAVRPLGTLTLLLTNVSALSSDCRVVFNWSEIR